MVLNPDKLSSSETLPEPGAANKSNWPSLLAPPIFVLDSENLYILKFDFGSAFLCYWIGGWIFGCSDDGSAEGDILRYANRCGNQRGALAPGSGSFLEFPQHLPTLEGNICPHSWTDPQLCQMIVITSILVPILPEVGLSLFWIA